jgi:3-oxoacyl-[acyl-carrier protein] reductase
MKLADRVVLVTGGSGDIGRAIVMAFAAEGARVAVGWNSNRRAADATVAAIRQSGGVAIEVQLDQGSADSIAAAVERVASELGTIDVLVTNAVAWPEQTETWDALVHSLTVNVAGTITLAESAAAAMRTKGWGRIVMVSSGVVDQPIPAAPGYPSAKGAIEIAARVLASREARNGILTNVVRPGFILTERALTSPGFGQDVIDAEAAMTPTGRLGNPEDVASAIVFLGSGANGHVNGETVSVTGGRELTH